MVAEQIKLTEMWKASNEPHYPIKMKTRETNKEGKKSRSSTQEDLTAMGRST